MITNTQLAAALMALGYKLLPMEFDQSEVVFDFGGDRVIADYQQEWRELSALPPTIVIGNTPLEIMFRMSRARQWVLKQVIHGNHNFGLTLPSKTLTTPDLNLVVALVANGCYLLKLDKSSRLFHFSEGARLEQVRYEVPSEWYGCARNYLTTLNQLVRKINNRNLTRQSRQHAITCTDKVSALHPMKEL